MSDCTKAIRSAVGEDKITEAQAADILNRMSNAAKARAAVRGSLKNHLRVDEALKEVAGELRAGDDSLALIDKRNRLLSIAAMKRQLQTITKGKSWAKSFKQSLLNTETDARALEAQFLSPLVAKLDELGLRREYELQTNGLEFITELRNIEDGGTAPIVPGDMGKKFHELAKFVIEQRKQRNAMLNRYGAYFPEAEHYTLHQTHSKERLWKMAGKMDDGHKSRARTAFFDLVAKVNVDPRTYEGRDASLFWSNFFENIYNGKHVDGVTEGIDVDRFAGVHGSMANKLSQGRLLWFADAESVHTWNEAIGAKGWAESITAENSNAARSIAVMRAWGPNWRNNLELAYSKLEELAGERTDSGAQIKKLQSFNWKAFASILSGESNVSGRPTASRIVDDTIRFTHMVKMGGVTISSLGDLVFVNNAMTMNGMSAMEAFAAQWDFHKMTRDQLVGLNLFANSFIGSLHNRYGVEPSSGLIGRAAHKLHNLNFFNKWNDLNQNTMAYTMSWWLGKHSDMDFARLPDGLREQLGNADIRSADWDAIRTIARKLDDEAGEMAADGKKFVMMDALGDITDEAVDRVIAERGLTVSSATRRRVRDDLNIRLSVYFRQQIDNALNTPDIETKYYTGQSLKAGTVHREVAKLATVFKSFPISVFLKTKRRAEAAGVNWGMLTSADWTKQQRSFVMSQARLIAMTWIAGYTVLTTRDYLNGRTRRRLFDENGKPNTTVMLDALAKGGGFGILGDVLFSEYDRQYKSALNAFAGPVFGLADQVGSIYTGARRAAMGDEEATRPASELAQLAQNNIPFANLFYIKPILNHFVFYNIREMLSPGVLKRAEKKAREMNYQDFWIEPSEVADIPISDPGRKIEALIP